MISRELFEEQKRILNTNIEKHLKQIQNQNKLLELFNAIPINQANNLTNNLFDIGRIAGIVSLQLKIINEKKNVSDVSEKEVLAIEDSVDDLSTACKFFMRNFASKNEIKCVNSIENIVPLLHQLTQTIIYYKGAKDKLSFLEKTVITTSILKNNNPDKTELSPFDQACANLKEVLEDAKNDDTRKDLVAAGYNALFLAKEVNNEITCQGQLIDWVNGIANLIKDPEHYVNFNIHLNNTKNVMALSNQFPRLKIFAGVMLAIFGLALAAFCITVAIATCGASLLISGPGLAVSGALIGVGVVGTGVGLGFGTYMGLRFAEFGYKGELGIAGEEIASAAYKFQKS